MKISALLSAGAMILAAPAMAQDPVAYWQGTLEAPESTLTIGVEIERGFNRALQGTMDSPDQGSYDVPITMIKYIDGRLTFSIPSIGASYQSVWDPTQKIWKGTFNQAGLELPLALSAVSATMPQFEQLLDGVYLSEAGGQFVIFKHSPSELVTLSSEGKHSYQRQPDGTYFLLRDDKTGSVRVKQLTDQSIEVIWKHLPSNKSWTQIHHRQDGRGVQSPLLFTAMYVHGNAEAVGQHYSDAILFGQRGSTVKYVKGADGLYYWNDQYGGSPWVLKVLSNYDVVLYDPQGNAYPYRGKREAPEGLAATWFQETFAAEQKREQEIQAWLTEQDRLGAIWEEEQAATTAWQQSGTSNQPDILGAFARGLSEATAKNDAMEQSMRDAANEGIRQGREEYARRQANESRQLADQRAAAAERAQIAREQQAEFARQEQERMAAAERTRLARLEQELIPQTSTQVGSTAGSASTDNDANRCVTSPEVSSNAAFQGNTSASVINGCGQPVDVLICLRRASDWNCGTDSGVQPQAAAIHSSFNATGPVHVDAKTKGNPRRFVYPAN